MLFLTTTYVFVSAVTDFDSNEAHIFILLRMPNFLNRIIQIMPATNAESVDSVDQLAQLPVFRNKTEQQVCYLGTPAAYSCPVSLILDACIVREM